MLALFFRCAVAAPRIRGKDKVVACALPHVFAKAHGLDPNPAKVLTCRLRQAAEYRHGHTDMGMMSSRDGPDAWGKSFRFPPCGAPEDDIPPGSRLG